METAEELIHQIKSYPKRLSWDEYFVSIAFLIASRSPCERLHVGSVIVKDHRIISAGYNGFPAGAPHTSIVKHNHEQNTIHSEQNAVSDAAKRGVSIDQSVLYVTHFPCIHCAKTIISSGIKTVKYKEEYKHDVLVDHLFHSSDIEVVRL